MRVLRAWVLATISPLLLMAPALAHGQTVSAMWDPNPSSDNVTSYEVCIGTTSLSCNFQLATVAASDTSYAFAPNPGVLYRVAVRAINASGPGPYSAEVLTSIPGLEQPPNQTSAVNVAISPLSLSASDPDGDTIQFTHSGLPFGLSLNQSTGIITGTPTSTGSFNVTIFVSDGTVTTSRSFVWTVNTGGGSSDTTAPSLNITSHSSGQTVSSSSITLAGTATDDGRGGSGIANVTVNGSAATGGTASGNSTANWSRNVALAAGANTFTVVAIDGAGNVRTASITINRSASDTAAPSVSITSHTSGQTLSSATITLAGTATDNGTGGSGIANVTVNGSAATGGTASGNTTANWNRTITLSAGTNVVTVVAIDGAGNVRTAPITLIAPTPVATMTSTSVVPNPAGPQVAGTSVTLTASAVGGTPPYSYKWWVQKDGGAWTMVRDWSTNSIFTWTPAQSGNYVIGLWARSAGLTTDLPQSTTQLPYVVSAPAQAPAPAPAAPSPAPAQITTSMVADRPSPQSTGSTVTFTATAANGTAPYSYKWWVQKDGGTWTMMRDWSTTTTFSWTPSQPGSYVIGLWTRSAGQTADLPQITSQFPFGVIGPSLNPAPSPAPAPPPPSPAPAQITTSMVADRPSPQNTGSTVTFTATAANGTAPYSYKWWVQKDGGTWIMMRDWSTITTFSWTPGQPGSYMIGLWTRSAGQSADLPQITSQLAFGVTGPSTTPPPSAPSQPPPPSVAPAMSASMTPDRFSPQNTGTRITFTATAANGTAPYSYKWWIQKDGGAWTIVQDWSTGTNFSWTPSQPGSYMIGLWTRGSGESADLPQITAQYGYTVLTASAVPMTGATLMASQPDVRAGTTVTLSAGGSGGTAPYSYKWWVQKDGGAWVLLRDWSTSTTLNWTPTSKGNYVIGLWARSAGMTTDLPDRIATETVLVTP